MSLRKQYLTDKNAETNGIEHKLPANKDKTIPTFILARMGGANKAYKAAFNEAIEPFRQEISLGTFTDEQAEQCTLEAFSKSVLIGWKNVELDDDVKIEYSVENVKEVMKELPDLYDELVRKAKDFNNFKVSTLKAIAKN